MMNNGDHLVFEENKKSKKRSRSKRKRSESKAKKKKKRGENEAENVDVDQVNMETIQKSQDEQKQIVTPALEESKREEDDIEVVMPQRKVTSQLQNQKEPPELQVNGLDLKDAENASALQQDDDGNAEENEQSNSDADHENQGQPDTNVQTIFKKLKREMELWHNGEK